MNFELVFQKLNKTGLQYVVIGGLAVNLHGYHRATGDIDIVISLRDEEAAKFVQVAKTLGWIPKIPVKIEDFAKISKRKEWIQQKNMKVFSVYNPKNPIEHVDVLIELPLSFETIFKNRVILKSEKIEIPVASIPDLIRIKEAAGRGRDLIDIKALKKIQEMKA